MILTRDGWEAPEVAAEELDEEYNDLDDFDPAGADAGNARLVLLNNAFIQVNNL